MHDLNTFTVFWYAFIAAIGWRLGWALMITVQYPWSGKRDSTDRKKKRSGFFLFKDHGTGVEYLATEFGGLTPRVRNRLRFDLEPPEIDRDEP